jgi:HPt (histidine-containing phosphotransfer) domain-containing protein
VLVIDPEVAGALALAVPQADYIEILRTFETDLDRLAQDCVRAVEDGDLPALRRAAHGLAGTAAGIGAHRLEAAARQAMEPNWPEAPTELAARIREEASAVLSELSAMAQRRPR